MADNNKEKEGVSVREIESFARKYFFEGIFAIAFILACFFSLLFFGPFVALIFAAAGGIVGVLFPKQVTTVAKKVFDFIGKQEKITKIVLAAVFIILSIFLPFLTFLVLGLHGGVDLHRQGAQPKE
jgi:hypothetical protein